MLLILSLLAPNPQLEEINHDCLLNSTQLFGLYRVNLVSRYAFPSNSVVELDSRLAHLAPQPIAHILSHLPVGQLWLILLNEVKEDAPHK